MSQPRSKWCVFHRDENGMESLEFILVVTMVILPLLIVPFIAAQIMTQYYYQTISNIITLPFP